MVRAIGGMRCCSSPGATGGGGILGGRKPPRRRNGNNEGAPTTRGEATRPVSFDVKKERRSLRRMEWQWDTVDWALTSVFVQVRNGCGLQLSWLP